MVIIENFGLDVKDHWNQRLEEVGVNDVYYLPNYAQLWNDIDGGISQAFYYENEEGKLFYPFRLRKLDSVDGLSKFSDWYDIASDYGYGGPVFSILAEENKNKFLTQAIEEFDIFCKRKKIVSEFCRFHPLLDNAKRIFEFYQPTFCNQTALIDLTLPMDKIWRQFRKGHRYDIRKAEKNGVTIRMAKTEKDLYNFHKLYIQTMNEVHAASYYYFPYKFFKKTMDLLMENADLFLAEYNEKPIAASIFLNGNCFCHYHFSGGKRQRSISPNKLLIWKVIKWAKKKGFQKLHLGGGYGHSDDNSLMLFKTGFTKLRAKFYIAKRIHHQDIYSQACQAKGIKIEKEEYFPAYRKR